MDRTEKQKSVELLTDKFSKAQFVSVHSHTGLSVEEIRSLRRELRSVRTEFRVVKNTLAKRAIQGTPLEKLGPHFRGPTAVAFSAGDATASAKALIRYAKDNPKLGFKAALLIRTFIDEGDFADLAKLPSRETLLATLFGLMKSPPTGLVNVLSGVLRKFLGTLQAIEQEKSRTARQ